MLTPEQKEIVLLLVLTGRLGEAREFAAKCEAANEMECEEE